MDRETVLRINQPPLLKTPRKKTPQHLTSPLCASLIASSYFYPRSDCYPDLCDNYSLFFWTAFPPMKIFTNKFLSIYKYINTSLRYYVYISESKYLYTDVCIFLILYKYTYIYIIVLPVMNLI